MTETDRMSFHKNRTAYGISLDEVATKAGLSVATVGAYERFTSKYTETRTRDENAARIENALNEVIKDKLAKTFTNAINTEKEVKVVEHTDLKGNPKYLRSPIAFKLNVFLDKSNISMTEFCKMCGINSTTFAPSTIKDHPMLRPATFSKILKATGWPEEYLTRKEDIPVEPIKKKEQKPMNKTYDQSNYNPLADYPKTVNSKLICEGPAGKIFDEKLICQDGRYFREYKVTIIRKEELTKDQFLNLINKKEEV